MTSSAPFRLSNQQKVLEPFAHALAAGFSEASCSALHSTASAVCSRIELVSLPALVKTEADATGVAVHFDAGIAGDALLVISHTDLGRLGGLLAGLEAPEGEPIAPEIVEACTQFFSNALEAAGKSFGMSCGLTVHNAALEHVSLSGNSEMLLELNASYADVMGLTLQLKVENRADTLVRLLVHGDLLGSLNAQLPQYGSATSVSADQANGAPVKADSAAVKSQNRWNIDLILDVELEVAVSFGETQMLLRDILKLGVGSVVEVDMAVNDPVTILVNAKPIARGEVVVVDGNYGVKVLEVESTADRIRSLG